MTDRLIRVFPRRTSHTPTDDLAFVGYPPLFKPDDPIARIDVSTTFTWDKDLSKCLADAWGACYPGVPVRIGGPAWGSPADGFTPGLYVREGVTFTSRGCDHACPWCLVPQREGRLRLIEDFAEGWIINDNSFLQTPPAHRQRVYAMLACQRKAVVFAGGLEAARVTDEVAAELCGLRIDSVFLAADTDGALRPLERALARLKALGRERLRCYVLCAYEGQTLDQAEARLRQVWALGAMPFAMLWQPADRYVDYSRAWRALARTWRRPAAMKAHMRERHTAEREENVRRWQERTEGNPDDR